MIWGRSPRFPVWILGLWAAGCFDTGELAGGSGSESTNGNIVIGLVSNPDGTPAHGAEVWIRRTDFLRDTALAGSGPALADDRVDSRGFFRLVSIPPGSYAIEIRDSLSRAAVLSCVMGRKDTSLAADTLRPTGFLKGKLELPSSQGSRAFVQVFGLERVVLADSAGAYSIPDLPEGLYRIHAVASETNQGYPGPNPVSIAPLDTAVLDSLPLVYFTGEDYALWPFSRTVRVNLATAGVAQGLADFPLLVRLRGGNFDFGLSDGKDLRFSLTDGTPLPYQIERWEPSTNQAEIWVKLDTVVAGSGALDLRMYWGKRDAPDFSNGTRVFDGFGAVWHLSEAQFSGVNNTVRDGSPTRADAAGPLSTGNRKAVWGYGGSFNGTHYLRAPGLPPLKPDSALTLSAWIKPTSTDEDGSEIAGLGDNYALRVQPNGSLRFIAFDDPLWTPSSPMPPRKWRVCDAAGVNVLDQRWHHVAGIFDGARLRIFLDGMERASVPYQAFIPYPLGRDFWMGRNGDGDTVHDYFGLLDEVQVSGMTRSAAWIRLAFETQKSGSAVLEFR